MNKIEEEIAEFYNDWEIIPRKEGSKTILEIRKKKKIFNIINLLYPRRYRIEIMYKWVNRQLATREIKREIKGTLPLIFFWIPV